MNMLTRALEKFIQRKRIYCEANPCCMSYGRHAGERADGSVYLFRDKHFPKPNNQPKETKCQQ